MSKKRLLSEMQIKRFMTLAGTKSLAEPFLKRLNEMDSGTPNRFVGSGDDLVMEDEDETEKDEEGGGDDMGGDEMPPEAPEGDMPPMEGEDEMPPAEGEAGHEGSEAVVQQLVSAIADAIQNVSGVEVTVSGAEGGEGEMPPVEGGEEMGGEMPPPVDGGEMGGEDVGGEIGGEMGGEMGGEEEEEAPLQEVKELTPGTDPNKSGGNKTDSWKSGKDHKLTSKELPTTLNTKTGGGPTVTDKPSAKGKAPVAKEAATGLSTLSEAQVLKIAKRVTERLMKEVRKSSTKGKK